MIIFVYWTNKSDKKNSYKRCKKMTDILCSVDNNNLTFKDKFYHENLCLDYNLSEHLFELNFISSNLSIS